MTSCAVIAGKNRVVGRFNAAGKLELEQLMSLVALGDQAAFARVYDALAPTVFGVALRVLRDRARAEEVTQEVMVRIWEAASDFDPSRGSLKSWVATIAHRRAVDVVRSVESSRRREDTEARRSAMAPFDEPAEKVEVEEDRAKMRAALAKLTDTQREAITLTYFDGMTYREAADSLGTSLGTMKTRIRDGLLKLRAELGVVDDG